MKIRSAFYVLCGLAVGLAGARAQTSIWTGASNTLWTNSGNWVSGLLPVTGSDVIFNGAGAGTSLVNVSLSLHSLEFQNTSALVLNASGTTLTFSGGTNIVAFASNSSVTLNVPLSGVGTNLWLNGGTGTLLLNPGTGSNTFSGSTQVFAGGTLTDGEDYSFSPNSDFYVGGGGSHGTVLINFNEMVPDIGDVSGGNGVITIAGGKTLFINSGFTTSYSGVISGAGNLEKDGSSTQILTGANTYTGTTTIGFGATLEIGDGTTTGSLQSTGITGSGGVRFDDPTNTAFAGTIAGSIGVSKAGAGTLTLSNFNTYSGATTVSAGTLQAGSPSAFGGALGGSAVSVASGATLSLNGFDNTIGTLNGSGSVSLGANTLLLASLSNVGIFSGNITGTGGITMNGYVADFLTGNSYSGTTTINNGTFEADNISGSAVGTSSITITSQGTLQVGNGDANGSVGTSPILNDGTIKLFRSDNPTFANNVSGSGGIGMFSFGTQIISGNNFYSGETEMFRGTLQAAPGATSAFGGSGNSAVVFDGVGSTLDLNSNDETLGSISGGAGSDFVTLESGNLTLGDTTASTVFGGTIEGAGAVNVNQLNLTLIAANTYTGITTIGSGATLQLGNGGTTGSLATSTVIQGTGTLVFDRSDSSSFVPVISGNVNVVQQGTGATFLSELNSYTGTTTINSGALAAGASSSFGTGVVTINGSGILDASFPFALGIGGLVSASPASSVLLGSSGILEVENTSNQTYAGTISGTGGQLWENGSAKLTLSGTSNYQGATKVLGGTLADGAAGAFAPLSTITMGNGALDVNFDESVNGINDSGGPSGTIVIAPGATLNISGGGSTTTAISGGGGLSLSGSATQILGSAASYTGPTSLGSGTALVLSGTGSLAGPVTGSGTLFVSESTSVSLPGNILGSVGVTQEGGGTTTLSGTNTYSGITTISAGTLQAGSTSAFGGVSGHSTVVLTSGTLDLNNFSNTVGSLDSANPSNTVALGSGTLTMVGTAGNAILAGITGTGGLTFSGTGTSSLQGTSNYSGTTTVNAGILQDLSANSFSPMSAVLVNSSGSLHVNFNEVVGNIENGGPGGPVAIASSAMLTSLGQAYSGDFMGSITGLGAFTISGGVQGLGGNNSYSGGTLVTGGGELFVSNNTAVGSGLLTFDAGTEFSPNANVALTNTILLVGGEDLDNDDGGANNMTLSGNISESGGAGSITWCTPGTLTLFGNNSFTGGIDMREGTLVLGNNNAAGNGGTIILDTATTLNVLSGITTTHPINFTGGAATLTGSGTIATPINAGASVIIAPMASPGGGPGDLTFSSGLTLAPGGAIHFDIYDAAGAAGTGYSLISATGGLSLTATPNSITFNIVSTDVSGNAANALNFSSSSAYSWSFATATSAISGFNPNEFHLVQSGFLNAIGGGSFSVSQTGNSLFLNFTPVPEPSTWCLIGAGLAAIVPFALRRRRLARA